MRFIWSLVGIAIGVLLIWKTFPIVNFLGRISWAEQTFSGGLGGTHFFIKLLGIVAIVLSIMYMFGIVDNLFSATGLTEGFTPQ